MVTLYLQNNQLSHFPNSLIAELPALEFISLKENPIANTDLLGLLDSGDDNCIDLLKEYIVKSDVMGTEKDNETKVLLVGNGNVGKTCFVNRMINDEFTDKWNSTHAINLEKFPSKKSNKELVSGFPYKLNFWDFGGQDIYHATHRLFMQADALYLLFWDEKTEKSKTTPIEEAGELREYENQPLSYWLSYINALGKGSPVIITRTKAGEDLEEITAPNHNELSRKYKKIIRGFKHIESKIDDSEENGYDELLQLIVKSIKKQKHNGKVLTNLLKLRSEIRDLQSKEIKSLSMKDYFELAKKCGISIDEGLINSKTILSDWLVKTGVVFYKDGLFKDEIILDQAWAIKAVYTLFDRDEVYYEYLQNKKGAFTGSDLKKVWKKNKVEEQELFISFMLQCEMCFEITPKNEEVHKSVPFEERCFIAPQLLSENKPNTVTRVWRNDQSWYLKYRFEFLHYGVIQSFIVRARKYAQTDDIWRNGILLYMKETDELGMVEALRENNKYEIRVRLSQNSKKLSDKIRNEIEAIQDTQAEVLLSDNGEDYVSLEKLESNPNVQDIEAENGKYVSTENLKKFSTLDKQERFEKVGDDKIKNLKHKAEYLKTCEANLSKQYKLLSEYETKLTLEDDPRTIMRYEEEIKKIKDDIKDLENRMKQSS